MTPTTTTHALTDQITACLEGADYAGLGQLYRPDVILDCNVPEWRFQLQGPQAILGYYEEETKGFSELRVAASRATLTADGVMVEMEVHFDQEGEERQWREVHILHTDGQRVTEHVIYCTGIWDTATIARQRAEAPMVQP